MTRKKNQTIASLAYQERSAKRLALTNLAKINSLEDNKMAANLQPEPVTPRAFPWRTLIAVLVCFGLIALAILAPTLGWVSACSGWLVASYWVGMIILIILIPLWILLASRFGWFWLVALLALALVLFGAFGGSWFSLCATTGTSPDNNTSDLPSGGSTTNESCGDKLQGKENSGIHL